VQKGLRAQEKKGFECGELNPGFSSDNAVY
jgi:hypothetical protein